MAIQRDVQWIKPSSITAFDTGHRAGKYVAVDGDTIVFSAIRSTVGAVSEAGRAWVYRRSALGVWTLEQELTPSTVEAGARFGSSVAISGDTVFVSAFRQNNGGTDLGSVYVFTRSGTTWTQSQEIVNPGANKTFGAAIACDSARLVVMDYDGSHDTYGDVYVYTYTGGTCTLEDSFTPLDESVQAYLGLGCAIDGDTIACTAAKNAVDFRSYVYRLGVGSWALEQALGTNTGLYVDVKGDTLVAGRPYVYLNPGTANVYRRSGVTWTREQTILGSDVFRDNNYGKSISISDDEKTIYVTAPGASGSQNIDPGGDVYRWDYDEATGAWVETWSDGWCRGCYAEGSTSANNDGFGESVALDGETLVVHAAIGGMKIYEGWSSTSGVGLDEPTGRHYNIYLKIDGLEPILWQYSHHGQPSRYRGWSRSFKTCLHAGSEVALDLDLGEMKAGMSAMTFVLDDIPDTDGESYFARLFAPQRYLTTSERCWVAKGTGHNQQVDADAEIILTEGHANLASIPSEYHFGQENIYVGTSGAFSLQGVIRGRYPCIGDNWAQTYPRPQDDEQGYRQQISLYPYSWIGRRVALYVTGYDDVDEDWCPEDESHLVWVGRIGDRIINRAKSRQWVLSCTSIMEELGSKKICTDMPTATLGRINLQGNAGREFRVTRPFTGDTHVFTVPAGVYTANGVVQQINALLANAPSWMWKLYICHDDAQRFTLKAVTITTEMEIDFSPFGVMCHAFKALGFDAIGTVRFTGEIAATEEPYTAYHPLHPSVNDSRIYLSDDVPVDAFWDTQGDNPTSSAVVAIKNATFTRGGDEKRTYLTEYTSKSVVGNLLYLGDAYNEGLGWSGVVDMNGYVGQHTNDPPVEVTQVYIPRYVTSTFVRRGPFEQLLYPLLSTGTTDYNHATYDKLPLSLSAAIQADLVDVDSFLEADIALGPNKLAHRKLYLIDEPITWMELVQRECKLFGYAVVWRDGKLTLVNMVAPDYAKASTWINEAVRAMDDWPDTDASVDTVVNQYECEVRYDASLGKYVGPKVIITDVNSVTGLQVVKSVTISHPGIFWSANDTEPIKEALARFLRSRWLALPSPVVHVSLNHTKMLDVFVGDTVRFASTRTPDPRGDGTYITACLATVLGLAWDYDRHLYTGRATLLLHGGMVTADIGDAQWWLNSPQKPWSGCALATAWDSVALTLTLDDAHFGRAGVDEDDGARFEAGYFVNVIERAPADPESPQSWGPLEVDSDYETDGAGLLTLVAGSALAGWDASKEYVVVYADRGGCPSRQKMSGTYQADPTTRLLEGTAPADRYS